MEDSSEKNAGPENAPFFETPIGRVTLEDGVAVMLFEHETLDVAQIEAHISMMLEVSQNAGQIAMPVLMDLGSMKWIGWEARVCGAELTRPEWNKKVAIYYHNPVQMVIAAFFVGVDRPPCPTIITGDRERAMEWLKDPGDGIPPPETWIPEPSTRLEAAASAVYQMGLGNLSASSEISGEQDELDAVYSGLAMLSEEIGGIFDERDRVENEARKHRRRLEHIVAERTAEVSEINESLKREITERKAAEAELKKINSELDGFAHTVSHDLKGPLAVIHSAGETLSLLVSKPESEDDRHALELADIISRNTHKATALIEDLLALAEAGQVPADVSLIDIGELIGLITEERSAEIEAKDITVMVADDLGEVRASPTHMYQVFANLLTNVIQHNDSDTPVIEVATLPAEAPEHHYLIRDNGSGIAEEDLAKVFLPFYKGAHGRTGIGLSTVSKLMAVYGGEVIAYNDNGACFELTIRDIDSSPEP